MSCVGKHKPKRLTPEEEAQAKQKRKEYKAAYFQKNKGKIQQYRQQHQPSKEKSRGYGFKWRYGISLEIYNQMVKDRNNRCDICGYQPLENAKQYEKLFVDHCHASNEVRGLLCFSCNTALGHFKDSSVLLSKAKEYLNKYGQKISNDSNNT